MADRRLQVFHAVAKHLSFTKAAETLCMTQPAVTFQVRQLEEQFETRLFDRAQGRIAPDTLRTGGPSSTPSASSGSPAELEARMREITGEVTGPHSVGRARRSPKYLLPAVMGEFKTAMAASCRASSSPTPKCAGTRGSERTSTLGFIEGDSHLPALASVACCADELQVVCAPSHASPATR
jgi:DNA-binding transcriptional LysR family regulator